MNEEGDKPGGEQMRNVDEGQRSYFFQHRSLHVGICGREKYGQRTADLVDGAVQKKVEAVLFQLSPSDINNHHPNGKAQKGQVDCRNAEAYKRVYKK
mgnify:CR=1 FL=1